jgi:hypothetical protein
MKPKDFLHEIIAERTRANPAFPALVEEARQRRTADSCGAEMIDRDGAIVRLVEEVLTLKLRVLDLEKRLAEAEALARIPSDRPTVGPSDGSAPAEK